VMPLVYGFLAMGALACLTSEYAEYAKSKRAGNPSLVD
jgi:hypothetical protein